MGSKLRVSIPPCMMVMVLMLIVSAAGSTDKFVELSLGDNNHLNLNIKISTHRKLLAEGGCTKEDISITQTRNSTSGTPQFTVQINNTCASYQCAPSEIHLHCRKFDFEGINPETFKRLSDDDCLVNGGNPLKTGESLNFTYSNSFMYRLDFMFAKSCPSPP